MYSLAPSPHEKGALPLRAVKLTSKAALPRIFKMDTRDVKGHLAEEIMTEFAERTGIQPSGPSPERYLWTDAFAVCNFLGLYRQTDDERYRNLALLLVDQVHAVLGRHRGDDHRTGWISGLGEEEGQRHPTKGGLRIGKKTNERGPSEPYDERLEWDRDGQYFHYLTQWMHALDCMSLLTGDATFNKWALELAKAAHAGFTYRPRAGREKRMYWKMSIDLSYPLVSSIGHHDPLDGLITYCELRATAEKLPGRSLTRELSDEIADMTAICEGRDWATDDPLGIGGLMIGAYRIAQLILSGQFAQTGLLETVLEDSLVGLEHFEKTSFLRLPADYRLAFRELGLSIGLQAIQKLQGLAARHPHVFRGQSGHLRIEGLIRHAGLAASINNFWREPRNRESANWSEHGTINMVMLATSLAPDGYIPPS